MKLIALTAAGLLAASALTPAPAEAQRHGWQGDRGWHGDRGGRGWHGGNRGWRGNQGWNRGPRFHGGRGYYQGGYGYNRGPGWNRGRTVCRLRPGYYGPVRSCYRVRY